MFILKIEYLSISMSVNIILSGAKSKSQYLSLCPLSDGRRVILVCNFQTFCMIKSYDVGYNSVSTLSLGTMIGYT